MQGKISGGRYQIIRSLGGGGFGQTFVAIDTHLPGSPQCVVKHLKSQANNESSLQIARRLFNQEAEVLYKLGNHPQIPRLFAHFEEEQEFYLVQEFIEGHELRQELRGGFHLSEAQVVAILQDILQILVFVHQQGVIHRDVKPSNLIRRRHDGKIVLIDFGAVKQIKTGVINSLGETSLTIAVGTPNYMPCEQREGKPRFCSDIYAVGIIGILALTGLLPKQLSEDTNTGEIVWRDRVQVSPELADILDKMVLYDFRQRYQSAAQVLEALNDVPLKTLTPTGILPVSAGEHNQHSLTTQPIVCADADTNLGLDETRLSDPLATATQNWKESQPPKKLPLWSTSRLPKVLLGSRRCLQVLAVSAVVTGLTVGVRHLRMLQTWELQAYDQMIRMRPSEKPDTRILIVKVDEKDIRKYGFPLPDTTLAQLLKKLKQHQPQAIGLDIYRDLPQGSGHKDFVSQLHEERLITICKLSNGKNDGIAPPPNSPTKQLGFSDLWDDNQQNNQDYTIRRHLLSRSPNLKSKFSPCDVSRSFSLQLALGYLKAKRIPTEVTPEQDWKLGNIVFKRLETNTGGYQNLDARGNQVLLNYRSSPEIAQLVTLTDILTNQFKPSWVKDRIVLIGVTAESVQDDHDTPYGKMRGLLIHAHMVSQILSAVLDKRPLLWWLPQWGDALWILTWSLTGGVMVWCWRSPLHRGLVGSFSITVLYGLCFFLLTKGGCVPLVPSALALVSTGGIVIAYTTFQTRKHK